MAFFLTCTEANKTCDKWDKRDKYKTKLIFFKWELTQLQTMIAEMHTSMVLMYNNTFYISAS